MSKNIQECLMTYYKGKGMNCAETTLLAANEAWNLEIPEDSVKLMGGFGGGMGSGTVCGAISGGIAACTKRNGKHKLQRLTYSVCYSRRKVLSNY